MIELLADMPAGVTGIRISGRLSGDDLREFTPRIQEAFDGEEVRIVEVIDPDYESFGQGGLIEDLKVGVEVLVHRHVAWKRIAVVSDMDWVAHALRAFAWMVPGELQIFRHEDVDEAKVWAAG